MPLINCPDCHRQVSTLAATCPACGYPMAGGGTTNAQGGRVQTIERTGKRFKLQQLLCGFLLLSAIALFVFGCAHGGEGGMLAIAMGVLLLIVGVLWAVLIRFLIWWHHS